VHLVGFIIMKFVMMHGHVNVRRHISNCSIHGYGKFKIQLVTFLCMYRKSVDDKSSLFPLLLHITIPAILPAS